MDRDLRPGERVTFRLGDIHLPDLAEVVARMTEDTELQGTVSLLSDQGGHRAAFAVIEVKGILMPLIVPASCIKKGQTPEADAAAAPAAGDKNWGLSLER